MAPDKIIELMQVIIYLGCFWIADVVLEVCKNMPAWPGRHLLESGEQCRYFGLRTMTRVIEFECKNKKDYEMWTKGVSRLLSIASETKNGRKNEPKQLSCATKV